MTSKTEEVEAVSIPFVLSTNKVAQCSDIIFLHLVTDSIPRHSLNRLWLKPRPLLSAPPSGHLLI
jgi:hypothetical protein